MPITILPERKTGLGQFVENATPFLNYAFQIMMQRKLEEQKRKRNLEVARQTNPELFTEQITPQGLQYMQQQIQKRGIQEPGGATSLPTSELNVPDKFKKFILNKEKLGQPSINVTTGEVSYKSEDAFNAYYRSLLPGAKEKSTKPQDNVVYRDMTGNEVPKEQAETDIMGGNTNYYTFKKEVTKSGIKETPISKPEDLQKMQQQKEKSSFIVEQAQGALNTINEVEKGIGHFGLFGQIPSIPGTPRYTWETNINKLLSGKMIDLMTQMKEASKTGATGFGQLSEKEGQILREASTALKRGLPPEKAQEYLNNMKSALQKVISNTGQPSQDDLSQMSDDELRKIAAGG